MLFLILDDNRDIFHIYIYIYIYRERERERERVLNWIITCMLCIDFFQESTLYILCTNYLNLLDIVRNTLSCTSPT
jgi:hypothetical protein